MNHVKNMDQLFHEKNQTKKIKKNTIKKKYSSKSQVKKTGFPTQNSSNENDWQFNDTRGYGNANDA